jgi:hypothetical protein
VLAKKKCTEPSELKFFIRKERKGLCKSKASKASLVNEPEMSEDQLKIGSVKGNQRCQMRRSKKGLTQ